MTKQIICDIIVRLLFIAFGIILVLKSRDLWDDFKDSLKECFTIQAIPELIGAAFVLAFPIMLLFFF